MIDDEIRKTHSQIDRVNTAINRLETLIKVANLTTDKVVSIETITDTQILSGDTIDRGKIGEMHEICNSVITDSEKTIESCENYLERLNDYLNSLYEKKRQMEGN